MLRDTAVTVNNFIRSSGGVGNAIVAYTVQMDKSFVTLTLKKGSNTVLTGSCDINMRSHSMVKREAQEIMESLRSAGIPCEPLRDNTHDTFEFPRDFQDGIVGYLTLSSEEPYSSVKWSDDRANQLLGYDEQLTNEYNCWFKECLLQYQVLTEKDISHRFDGI